MNISSFIENKKWKETIIDLDSFGRASVLEAWEKYLIEHKAGNEKTACKNLDQVEAMLSNTSFKGFVAIDPMVLNEKKQAIPLGITLYSIKNGIVTSHFMFTLLGGKERAITMKLYFMIMATHRIPSVLLESNEVMTNEMLGFMEKSRATAEERVEEFLKSQYPAEATISVSTESAKSELIETWPSSSTTQEPP